MVDIDLEQLEERSEDAIMRRINHLTFARTLLWLHAKFDHYPCIYVQELAKFLKRDYTSTYKILQMFEALELIKFKHLGNIVEITPVLNDDFPIVTNYVKYAKKTCGIK